MNDTGYTGYREKKCVSQVKHVNYFPYDKLHIRKFFRTVSLDVHTLNNPSHRKETKKIEFIHKQNL